MVCSLLKKKKRLCYVRALLKMGGVQFLFREE